MARREAWQNWAGNQRADGVEVVRPRGTAEIADVVRAAAGSGRSVRPIGTGHSFSAVGVPRDVQLRLDRHDGLVRIDVERGLVTVQAGMPLHRLNRLLEQAGLAMTNLGDIEQQTISGALATGTHGTGHAFGGLATQVHALDLVLADGSVLTCSAQENPDVFEHARLGLGALGVVSTVTLRVEPAYALRAHEAGASLAEVTDRFEEWALGTDHFEFYWFPHTDRCLTKRNTRLALEGDQRLSPVGRLAGWWEDEFLSNTVFGATVALGERVPATVRPLARLVSRALSERTFTDLSHRVFTSPRRVRFEEMEYAVPREQAMPVLAELVARVRRSDWRLSVPVEVRVAAADDVPLSTAHGRDTAYLAVHVAPGSRHRDAYFGALEAIVREVDGRPHWGKLHSLDADALRGRYPRFADFVAMRDRLDPAGVFANDYLDRVLGPRSGAATA